MKLCCELNCYAEQLVLLARQLRSELRASIDQNLTGYSYPGKVRQQSFGDRNSPHIWEERLLRIL